MKMNLSLNSNSDFWQSYQNLVLLRSKEALNHTVAAPKIAFALIQTHNTIEISKALVKKLNHYNIENINNMN